MEKIIQERIYPEVKNYTPPLKVSPLFMIVFALLMGFAVIAVGTRSLAQYIATPPNPFEPFADIFPGESKSAFTSRGATCDHYFTPLPVEICTVNLLTGDFSQIEAVISNYRIKQITFVMRGNTLRIGDLELLLRRTDFQAKTYGVVFSWHGSIGITSSLSDVRGSSLFRPVWKITFMDTPLTWAQ